MASEDEIIMKINEDYLEETNEKVLNDHHEKTGKPVYIHTYPYNLAQVFPKVSEYCNSGNRKQDLIEKAAAILAAPAWIQAFDDGNRRTGIISADKFLHDNGYSLDINPSEENETLREMLKEIKRHMRDLDSKTMQQLILYTKERVYPL